MCVNSFEPSHSSSGQPLVPDPDAWRKAFSHRLPDDPAAYIAAGAVSAAYIAAGADCTVFRGL